MIESNLVRGYRLSGHTDKVKSLTFHKNSVLLASGSSDRTVRVWDIKKKSSIVFEGHKDNGWFPSVNCVAFHPHKNIVASGSKDKSIKLWSLETQTEIKSLTGHSQKINAIAFHPHQEIIASASHDKLVKLWSIETGQNIYSLEGHSDHVLSVAFSPDGKLLASGGDGNDKTIRLWDLENNKTKILTGHSDWFGGIFSILFSHNGKFIVSCSNDKKIKLWLVETGEELLTLTGHTEEVTSIALSFNNKFLVSGSKDKTLKLWNLKEKRCLASISHKDKIYAVAISPFKSLIN
ncbi:WD40 repeat domain-containing protein [Crocosphaera sp.]|uniref:WD40 repeat domain-containing protein n=1 Tax=Crocosphaera sp. TaxID=2729996 RepID=UPI00257E6C5B|nr:WD40 repeat domain-containing protein [Crocosphaera sp.]NQZ62258.1 WD40 repeat domain-containing protein [Crocosphaera sp.]